VNMVGASQIFKHEEYVCFWNPLTDDGDALRLAASLEMDICFHSEGAELMNVNPHVYTDDSDGDQMQATRRAITRAAAAIGEQQNELSREA